MHSPGYNFNNIHTAKKSISGTAFPGKHSANSNKKQTSKPDDIHWKQCNNNTASISLCKVKLHQWLGTIWQQIFHVLKANG